MERALSLSTDGLRLWVARRSLWLFRLNLALLFCAVCPITPDSPVILNFSILTCHMVQTVGNLAAAGLSHSSPAHHLQATGT